MRKITLGLIGLLLGCGKPYLEKEQKQIKIDYTEIKCFDNFYIGGNPTFECKGNLSDGSELSYSTYYMDKSYLDDRRGVDIAVVVHLNGDVEYYQDDYNRNNWCGGIAMGKEDDSCHYVLSGFSLIDRVAFFKNLKLFYNQGDRPFHKGNEEETQRFIQLRNIAFDAKRMYRLPH